MEFPDVGDQCQWKECQKLDFLPINCKYCSMRFCEDHFLPEPHQCAAVLVAATRNEKTTPQNVKCSMDTCNVKDVVEMLCVKCRNHFCLLHRYHQCFQYDSEEMAEAKRKLAIPRQQFEKSLESVSAKIEAGLEKGKMNSKTRATAYKVQLMRLKSKAKGEGNIATSERVYFLVNLPYRLNAPSAAVYVSKEWSIGRIIDSISKLYNVPNHNNIATAEKLRLFCQTDEGSAVITNDFSTKLSAFLDNGTLNNGDTLSLDYIKSESS